MLQLPRGLLAGWKGEILIGACSGETWRRRLEDKNGTEGKSVRELCCYWEQKWTRGVVVRGVESKEGLIKTGVIPACWQGAAVGERMIPGVISRNR